MRADLSLYLVTDTAQCGDRGVVETVRAAVAGGVSCVQVRDKDAGGADLLQLVRAVAEAVGERVPVVVDDRVEVYLAARAYAAPVAGVHVGQDDLPADVVRRLVGPDALLGLTAHTPAQLEAADALPAGTVDYLGVGVVRATQTKPDHPPPLGVDGFGDLVRRTPLPCVAIGGVGAEQAAPLRAVGAAGIAVVSALCAAADPQAAARELRAEWDR